MSWRGALLALGAALATTSALALADALGLGASVAVFLLQPSHAATVEATVTRNAQRIERRTVSSC
jgi:hypothetical protein